MLVTAQALPEVADFILTSTLETDVLTSPCWKLEKLSLGVALGYSWTTMR